jgi:hypothetical protein
MLLYVSVIVVISFILVVVVISLTRLDGERMDTKLSLLVSDKLEEVVASYGYVKFPKISKIQMDYNGKDVIFTFLVECKSKDDQNIVDKLEEKTVDVTAIIKGTAKINFYGFTDNDFL